MHSGSSVWKFHFRDILLKTALFNFPLIQWHFQNPKCPGYTYRVIHIYPFNKHSLKMATTISRPALYQHHEIRIHVVELLVLYYIALLIYKSARSTTNSISIGTKVNGSFSLLKQHWCCLLWIFLNDVEKPSCFWLSCMFFYSF